MMKHILHFLVVFSLLAVAVPTVQAQETSTPRDRIRAIENYVVYYGQGRVDDLARYDLAIIQPDTLNTDELAALKAQGTLVVSYLSIGEAEPEREWYLDGRVDPAWELGTNENWGSRFIDANQTGWQDLMIALTGEFIAKGFDGVFLDTVDTVDMFPQTLPGMVEIIRRLRATYPDALLVQNRGFTVVDQTAGDIDALMFEDLVTTYDFINSEYLYADNSYVAQQMAQLHADTGVVILALDYVAPDNPAGAYLAIQAANEYGFIPAVSTIMLDDIPDYHLDGPQQVDIRVRSIDVETNGDTYTLVITVENVGLAATTKAINLSLSIGSEQVAKFSIESLGIGEQAQWRYDWASPPQSASVRVIAFSLDDKHPGNNSLQFTYHAESVPVEPLLPADQQRRRPAENGPDLLAMHLTAPLTIDGSLDDWGADAPCVEVNQADQIIYGDPATWTGPEDLSGRVCYAWDDEALYVGFTVVDDAIVQSYTGGDLWRGDHVELWFDTQLQLDFDSDQNSDDDFQVGISPGDFDQVAPDLVIWTPARLPDSYADVEFAVVRTGNGYSAEIRFPVQVLSGLRLAPDHALGASFDPSDTDTPDGTDQETMLSTANESQWGVPTLWNNLILQN
jgi:uncharacterized protein (TIGR01370 family)